MNKMFTELSGMYNLLTQRKSGERDKTIFKTTLKLFQIDNNRRSFKFMEVWYFLTTSWKLVKDYGSEEDGLKKTKVSKMSYTNSLDANFGVDFNEKNALKLEEVLRPIGRDKVKMRESSYNASRVKIGDKLR